MKCNPTKLITHLFQPSITQKHEISGMIREMTCIYFFCVQCSDSGGVKCITNDGAHFVNPNLFGVKKSSSDIFSSFGSFFSSALSLPFNLFKGISGLFGGAWTYIQYVFYFMIFLFVFWLFNQCGGANLIQKLFKKGNSQKLNW